MWPGEFGFLQLEYTGEAPTPRTWPGPITGTAYRFGGSKRTGYVDKRDGLDWLSMRDGAAKVFRLYREKQE